MSHRVVNVRGQIIAEYGIEWRRSADGFFSIDPRGYFIERLTDSAEWTLFRKQGSAIPERIPFVRQKLAHGTIVQCQRVAEIYEIRRVA